MAASKRRVDAALLVLRVGVGGLAIHQGLQPFLQMRGGPNLKGGLLLLLAGLKLACGVLLVAGVWMFVAALGLVTLLAWPLVLGWIHGAPILGQPHSLSHLLATVASGLGGGGLWAAGRD